MPSLLHARGQHSAVTGLGPGRLLPDLPTCWGCAFSVANGSSLLSTLLCQPRWVPSILISMPPPPSLSAPWQVHSLGLRRGPWPCLPRLCPPPHSHGLQAPQADRAPHHGSLAHPQPSRTAPGPPPILLQSSRQAPSLTSDAPSSVGGLGALPPHSSRLPRLRAGLRALPLLSSPASLLMAAFLPTCLLATQACRAS